MYQPTWNDPDLKAGTMVRTALWLVQEVGEGNIFTKDQLRSAFPGVSQVDRRLRDLRDYGWVILTNTEDATLTSEDQRLVKVGVPVWDRAARRAASPKQNTTKEIQAAMARDNYICTVCGIAGGEPYIDEPNKTAVLSVSRRATLLPDNRQQALLATECKRCRTGTTGTTADAAQVLSDIKALDPEDRRRLARWMQRGRRGSTPLERAWIAYQHLPAEARDEIQASMDL